MARLPLALALLAFALHTASAQPAAVVPADLRCEYLARPLGLDVKRPRLSWTLTAARAGDRGLRQSAFRILVASDPAALRGGRGDLWDSGRVASRRQLHVEYAGKPLRSFQRCWWAVRVWDQAGRPSAWSRPAHWSMGVLNAAEWRARWIAAPATLHNDDAPEPRATPLSLEGASWVWSAPGAQGQQTPIGATRFRRAFAIPAGARVAQARVVVTGDDQFRLFINGQAVLASDGQGYAWQRPLQADISSLLQPGTNLAAVEVTNQAVSPAGMALRLEARLADGTRVTVASDRSWKASADAPAGWETPGLDDASWGPAAVLGSVGMAPWNALRAASADGWPWDRPSPLMRREFTVDRPVRAATLVVCGLGYHEARLNGRKVGDGELQPTFTNYDRRVLYVTHDVTSLLRRGPNAVGLMLGNGVYNQAARDAWDFQRAPWRGVPRALAMLRVEYADGSVRTVGTDAAWQCAAGPIRRDSLRNGEVYDARRELAGWDLPGYNAAGWKPAVGIAAPRGTLKPMRTPPVRVTQTLPARGVAQPAPGVYVVDFGQNTAGRARLRVSGPAGTRVTLRYAERVAPNGALDQAGIASLVYEGPFQTETYILKGSGVETYESRFTYHGFRWVEVTGLPGRPAPDTLQARVMHTDFGDVGGFRCSNALLNDIQRLTDWAYRSNYVGIPTDCPHREKNGWTGDAHLAAEQAMYNWDNAAAYTKWVEDLRDAQGRRGDLPGIVPTGGWGFQWGNGPAWDSATILIPWYLYVYRGDTRLLSEHYESMRRYVDYMTSRASGHIVDFGLGDWVPAKTETPVAVTSTGYYYLDARLLGRIAGILGRTADARKYGALAERIREAFNARFAAADGGYANNSQTALSAALHHGLAPAAMRERVAARLAADIEARGGHLDTGILGAKYLFRALTETGRVDLALRVATQTTPPSYGSWLARGATTLWEDWGDGSSRNHIMFGDVSAWFYQALAGIEADPDRPAMAHVVLRPRVPAGLASAEAWHRSPYGMVRSGWRKEGDRLRWTVEVPPNSAATLYVPARSAGDVTEGGRPLGRAPGLRVLGLRDGTLRLAVGSGRYELVTRP